MLRRSVFSPVFLLLLSAAFCLVALPVPALAQRQWVESESTKRVALVIGNAAYQYGRPLKNPTNDADAITKMLKSLGFDVIEVTDGTHRQMLDAIDAFGDKLTGDCIALCYYSGHGAQIDGTNYLLPVDFRGKSRADAEDEAIAARRILGRLDEKHSPVNILILDACRNNPFKSFSRSGEEGLSKMDAPRGTLIAYATAPGNVADDNSEGQNGLYTTALLKELPRSGIKVEEMFKQVLEDVATASGEKQTPWVESSLRGNLFLAKGSGVSGEIEAHDSGKKINVRARLKVTTNVPDAKITVDGKPTNGGSYSESLLDADKKAVVITATAAGYEPDRREVILERGTLKTVEIVLEKSGETGSGGESPPPSVGNLTPTRINQKDQAEMILIPAGEFLMGSDKHKATLSADYIYKNLVTVGMYEKFCQATKRDMPPAPDFNPNWSKKEHPIVWVTWEDAKAYCEWAGVKLPTEAQWEKAARGTKGNEYPWGDTWDASKCWCSKNAFGDAGGTARAGAFPSGASPYGVLDMAGNVWQWCEDWYDPSEKEKVLKGDSWFDLASDLFQAAYRLRYVPAHGDNIIGFRACLPRL